MQMLKSYYGFALIDHKCPTINASECLVDASVSRALM